MLQRLSKGDYPLRTSFLIIALTNDHLFSLDIFKLLMGTVNLTCISSTVEVIVNLN